MSNEIFKHVASEAPNRRSMLKRLAAASAALGSTQLTGNAQSTPVTPLDVLQFLLNNEYLESEFYSVAVLGQTLEQRGIPITGSGTPGPTVTQYSRVNFGNNLVLTFGSARDVLDNETAHVLLLRNTIQSLGATPVAKPAINLDAMDAMGASLRNQQTFLVQARALEDVGISGLNGGAPILAQDPNLAQSASRIQGAEGQHVGQWRLNIARLGIPTIPLDAADVIPPPSGLNLTSTNKANGLTAFRTPGQVLYIQYGMQANVSAGGFFPNGVNGNIRTSTGPATAANLA